MSHLKEIDIIKRVLEGDSNAFVHLIREYQDMVFTLICRMVKDKARSEDLTQDVFIKVFQELDRFRIESKFSTYLYRIAYNMTIDYLRKEKRSVVDYQANYDFYLENKENRNSQQTLNKERQLSLLEKEIDLLPDEDRLLIHLYYFNDHSIAEVSTIVSHSESNVKTRLYRIRKVLQDNLKGRLRHEE